MRAIGCAVAAAPFDFGNPCMLTLLTGFCVSAAVRGRGSPILKNHGSLLERKGLQ